MKLRKWRLFAPQNTSAAWLAQRAADVGALCEQQTWTSWPLRRFPCVARGMWYAGKLHICSRGAPGAALRAATERAARRTLTPPSTLLPGGDGSITVEPARPSLVSTTLCEHPQATTAPASRSFRCQGWLRDAAPPRSPKRVQETERAHALWQLHGFTLRHTSRAAPCTRLSPQLQPSHAAGGGGEHRARPSVLARAACGS